MQGAARPQPHVQAKEAARPRVCRSAADQMMTCISNDQLTTCISNARICCNKSCPVVPAARPPPELHEHNAGRVGVEAVGTVLRPEQQRHGGLDGALGRQLRRVRGQHILQATVAGRQSGSQAGSVGSSMSCCSASIRHHRVGTSPPPNAVIARRVPVLKMAVQPAVAAGPTPAISSAGSSTRYPEAAAATEAAARTSSGGQ